MNTASTNKMTLFYTPRSRAFAALWLLEELGVEYHLESFDLSTGRHKKADYLALNPMGKVPLVVDDGTPVSELGAIAIYLSDRYPNAELCPRLDDSQRPAFLKWILFSSAIMEPAFAQKLFNWQVPPTSIAWGSFDQMLEVVTRAITGNTWLLGDSFSSADILVGSNLRVGQMMDIIPKEGPLAEYISRLETREGFIRASAIEAKQSDRFPPPPAAQQL